jgi:protein-S-isoprenylcysteine O-methyltransferase Ste14
MKLKPDSPGVYLPPPLIYVIVFIAAVNIQKMLQIDDSFFHTSISKGIGILLLVAALYFLASSLTKFFKTKNTVVLIKPASSLQTTGVYAISRNPMYIGLLFLYLAITFFIGNWWNLILLPLLIFIVQAYVIRKEEQYLDRAFGHDFREYKKRVRRWI